MSNIKVKLVISTLSPNNTSLKIARCHYLSIKNTSATDVIYQTSSGRRTLTPGQEQIYPVPSGCVLEDTITFQGIATTVEVVTMIEA